MYFRQWGTAASGKIPSGLLCHHNGWPYQQSGRAAESMLWTRCYTLSGDEYRRGESNRADCFVNQSQGNHRRRPAVCTKSGQGQYEHIADDTVWYLCGKGFTWKNTNRSWRKGDGLLRNLREQCIFESGLSSLPWSGSRRNCLHHSGAYWGTAETKGKNENLFLSVGLLRLSDVHLWGSQCGMYAKPLWWAACRSWWCRGGQCRRCSGFRNCTCSRVFQCLQRAVRKTVYQIYTNVAEILYANRTDAAEYDCEDEADTGTGADSG